MTTGQSWLLLSDDEEAAVRKAAEETLAALADALQRTGTAPARAGERLVLRGRMLLAEAALLHAATSVGTCHCGRELYFVGRLDGLWVECGNNPPHGWRVAT